MRNSFIGLPPLGLLEAISKMSFGPISLLAPRFKSFNPPQADLRLKTQFRLELEAKSYF
jgi:hypothetical protein